MASPIGVVGQLLKRVQLQQGNDEWADRVHYVLAPTLLMFMATVHGMKQYFGKTIEVWIEGLTGMNQPTNQPFVHSFTH